MHKIAQFLLGLIVACIYVIGISSTGFIFYEHLQSLSPNLTSLELLPLIMLGIVTLIPLLLVTFKYCPGPLKWGAFIPQILMICFLGYFISQKEVVPFFTDDVAYRSCVGNFDHGQGISDCTALIYKLENADGITLKDIENTKGDYWLAEMLSYRGRHYMRNDQFKFGKEDFARAFLLPEGGAVVAGNLAEAGFIRQELFEADYEKELAKLKQLVIKENINSTENASNFLIAQMGTTIELCRLATGRDQNNCKEIVEQQAFGN